MRLFLLPLLLLAAITVRAEPASAKTLLPLFELAGIHLLCEQTVPMLQRGQGEAEQKRLAQLFAGETFCLDLARRVGKRFDDVQGEQVRERLDSPLAQRFTAAERAVGEQPEGLAEYRQRLQEQPPRGVRLELIKRLDAAARTTELASLLRYEVGKTQALLALRARGETLSEAELQAQTQKQAEAIRQSSEQAVESFMFYAYRQMPSDQLADYAALYEHPSVSQLLAISLEVVPQLFAERRQQLRKTAGKP
ncbi:hypothetical protein OEG79_01045 [Pseudomonas sp. Z8(2022)]|jgi:hypothetical protein|uniref:hypothetical protein n=1 Tax=Pseudomonas sp. Z8(2022) TaxID=2962597 RepID=UPI0021F46F17|nr:hypothetical protein [Pseudomonas sp. Z8(2022)]UYP30705.1 hypothetical protein OEG79_01045 [Pseudomonas sp. Z8(2022)]